MIYSQIEINSLESLKNTSIVSDCVDLSKNIPVSYSNNPNNNLIAYSSTNAKLINELIKSNLVNALDTISKYTSFDFGSSDADHIFGDTTRALAKTTTKTGADTISWHKTGRAIDLNQGASFIILKDPIDSSNMAFRLLLKKQILTTGIVVPNNYIRILTATDKDTIYHPKSNKTVLYNKDFIDVTTIMEENGFARIPAHQGWEKSWNKREWWHYEKRDGLSMYEALAQVYSKKKIIEGYKGIVKANRYRYGSRLIREGFPDNILHRMISPIIKEGLCLYFRIGKENKVTPNSQFDVNQITDILNELGGYIKEDVFYPNPPPPFNIKFNSAIGKFQKENNIPITKRITPGDKTHIKLGKIKKNKRSINGLILYGNIGPSNQNYYDNYEGDINRLKEKLNNSSLAIELFPLSQNPLILDGKNDEKFNQFIIHIKSNILNLPILLRSSTVIKGDATHNIISEL